MPMVGRRAAGCWLRVVAPGTSRAHLVRGMTRWGDRVHSGPWECLSPARMNGIPVADEGTAPVMSGQQTSLSREALGFRTSGGTGCSHDMSRRGALKRTERWSRAWMSLTCGGSALFDVENAYKQCYCFLHHDVVSVSATIWRDAGDHGFHIGRMSFGGKRNGMGDA